MAVGVAVTWVLVAVAVVVGVAVGVVAVGISVGGVPVTVGSTAPSWRTSTSAALPSVT